MRTSALTTLAAASAVRVGVAPAPALAGFSYPSCFRLCYYGDPSLNEPAITVETIDELERGLVDAMDAIMTAHRGLGIAAQQVGGRQRVCIVTWDKERHVLINPRILNRSGTFETHVLEGCLSAPDFRTSTRRDRCVTVEYEDLQFVTKSRVVMGLNAQVVQHEIDHLAGTCIVDRVPRQQRREAMRLLEKHLRVRSKR